jgi:Ca-activated chloride channel family protein
LISDEDILTQTGREEAAEEYMATPTMAPSGAPAVEMAEEEKEMRSADSAAPPSAAGEGTGQEETGRTVRHVGAKTFVLEDGMWMDTAFDPEAMRTEKVGFGSEAYFELLAARPAWGDYLALGDRVIFVAGTGGTTVAYEIVVGEGEPIEALPMETAAPPEPTDEPGDDDPATETPTAAAGGDVRPSASSGLCPGPLAMSVVALLALAVWKGRGACRPYDE